MMGLNMPHRNPKIEFLYLSFRFFIPSTITNLAKLEGSLKTFMYGWESVAKIPIMDVWASTASQNHPHGIVNDLDVEQERPVVDVEQVQFHPVFQFFEVVGFASIAP